MKPDTGSWITTFERIAGECFPEHFVSVARTPVQYTCYKVAVSARGIPCLDVTLDFPLDTSEVEEKTEDHVKAIIRGRVSDRAFTVATALLNRYDYGQYDVVPRPMNDGKGTA